MHQNHLSDPFRVLRQEKLQCVELLGNTLDVIQSIYADNELNAVEPLLELVNPLLYRLFCEVLENHRTSIGDRRIERREVCRMSYTGAGISNEGKLLTSVKDVGSMPIGKVPTLARRPENSTPFGIVGRPKIRVHEERKWRA